ncbi:hypothetical protein ACF0HZ_07415 [Leuconostoc suionicum]|uniref:hypothetical protein n=1 Tax=Leuconostoc suionicum TaxID=1511761 RepID=UPI00374A2CD6
MTDFKDSILEEYKIITKMNYTELVTFLREKYGVVPGDYFLTPTCKSKNSKISRSMEGLEVHHIGEDMYANLSEPSYALKAPWGEQNSKKLVYCNLLEHTMLHVLISEQKSNAQPYFIFKSQLINDILNDYPFKRAWLKVVYSQMKDHKDLLIKLYTRVGLQKLLNTDK